jgi:hypothetical protein
MRQAGSDGVREERRPTIQFDPVVAALVAAIHAVLFPRRRHSQTFTAWMAGTGPAVTKWKRTRPGAGA